MRKELLEKLFDYDFDGFEENASMPNAINDDISVAAKAEKFIAKLSTYYKSHDDCSFHNPKLVEDDYMITDLSDNEYVEYKKDICCSYALSCFFSEVSKYQHVDKIDIFLRDEKDYADFISIFNDNDFFLVPNVKNERGEYVMLDIIVNYSPYEHSPKDMLVKYGAKIAEILKRYDAFKTRMIFDFGMYSFSSGAMMSFDFDFSYLPILVAKEFLDYMQSNHEIMHYFNEKTLECFVAAN